MIKKVTQEINLKGAVVSRASSLLSALICLGSIRTLPDSLMHSFYLITLVPFRFMLTSSCNLNV